jgi:hypothetical protein
MMWISKAFFELITGDNKRLAESVEFEKLGASRMSAVATTLREQKAKDDMTIDWMRHRVNALEKQNSILMGKATGLHFPVPEIVPTRPGTISGLDFNGSMPSFEDVGETEAASLGIGHDAEGHLTFKE